MQFKFEKEEDDRWFIVLPEWKGLKEDLQMVQGADVMLDILAQGEGSAILNISETPTENPKLTLTFIKKEAEGGIYNAVTKHHEFRVWLCKVTKFVFGKLPEKLYCN